MPAMLDSLRLDVTYALRQLHRNPGFAGILGLGIGAATAIFTVVDGVLLRPLPYPHADRIVWIREVAADGHRMAVAGPNFVDVQRQSRSFAALAEAGSQTHVSVTRGAEPIRSVAVPVSRDFFRVIGVSPARGRGFLLAEEMPGAAPAVIRGWDFWQHSLAGGALASKTLKFDGRLFRVFGVMPRGFDFPQGTDLWVPAELLGHNGSRTAHNWAVVGPLSDSVSLSQARTDLTAIARRIKSTYGDDVDLVDLSAVRLRDHLTGAVRTPLLVLLGAAGFLLLIAVANVGNLLLARLTARDRELAVCRALGAGRGPPLGRYGGRAHLGPARCATGSSGRAAGGVIVPAAHGQKEFPTLVSTRAARLTPSLRKRFAGTGERSAGEP